MTYENVNIGVAYPPNNSNRLRPVEVICLDRTSGPCGTAVYPTLVGFGHCLRNVDIAMSFCLIASGRPGWNVSTGKAD